MATVTSNLAEALLLGLGTDLLREQYLDISNSMIKKPKPKKGGV
jgi:hypothetical protein